MAILLTENIATLRPWRLHALQRHLLRAEGKGQSSNEDSATIAASLLTALVYFLRGHFRSG